MKKFLFYGHGGAWNHGAEAIVRTTAQVLRGQGEILLSTHFPEQDREFRLDELVDRVIPANRELLCREKSAESMAEKTELCREIYRQALDEIDENTLCLAVGGDNYCYPNWHRQALFHRTARQRGARSILWCCSIEPGGMDGAMLEVLREHDQVYARESVTWEALIQRGIPASLLPDPAFLLDAKPVPLPAEFVPGETAAVNLSPLVLRRCPELLEAYTEAVRWLLKYAGSVVLVPHVTMRVDNDLEALRELQSRLTPEEARRVLQADPGWGCRELKFLISQCSLLLCSRTHASIAGYSSGIPTLVTGYSVKARGIGRDMGMEEFVLRLEQAQALPERVSTAWQQRRLLGGRLKIRAAECRRAWMEETKKIRENPRYF